MVSAAKSSRLDSELVRRGLVPTRSQAESYIKLQQVTVDGKVATKPGFMTGPNNDIKLLTKQLYVSRAGHKLASIADIFGLDFRNKTVLDVGSSTGGFSDYALQNGAGKVIAVDVGSNQLHPSLRSNPKLEVHEQTDVRSLVAQNHNSKAAEDTKKVVKIANTDLILIDVSFISLKEILPHILRLMTPDSIVVAMVKPQFEAGNQNLKHKGVIKNEALRRKILRGFEDWAKQQFKILSKADSLVPGEKGNKERFYLLKKLV